MKRVFALLLILIALLPLCGCGKDGSGSGDEEQEIPPPGAISRNIYRNDYLKLKFTLPEGWVYLTDTQISGYNQNMKISEVIEKGYPYYDMVARDRSGTGAEVSVTIFTFGNITVEKYLQRAALATRYKKALHSAEYTDYTIGGEKYTGCTFYYNPELNKHEEMLLVRKLGQYFICIELRCGELMNSLLYELRGINPDELVFPTPEGLLESFS